MVFKYPGLSREYSQLHPKVKALGDDLDIWVREQGWPDVMITHVVRTAAQQEAWYWKSIYDATKVTEELARAAARKKPSWHFWYCAFDFSSKRYSVTQERRILEYLQSGRGRPDWEIYGHNIGQGDHFHVAFRDVSWKAKWSQQLTA